MTYGEVNNQAEDIVERSNEGSCSKRWVNLKFIERHWNPCSKEACENDYTEQCYARGKGKMIINLEKHAHTKYDY